MFKPIHVDDTEIQRFNSMSGHVKWTNSIDASIELAKSGDPDSVGRKDERRAQIRIAGRQSIYTQAQCE